MFGSLGGFSFLLLCSEGSRGIVAPIVDGAPVTFLPCGCQEHWTGRHGRGPVFTKRSRAAPRPRPPTRDGLSVPIVRRSPGSGGDAVD